MEHALHVGPPGRWWDNPNLSKKLSLASDQQERMDNIFQKSRFTLIDLMATLQKEEAIMEPLVDADQPDVSKVVVQIDKVAQARANLEKANARMLLGLRRVLTPDQWKKLQAEAQPMPFGGLPPPGGGY
jgi:Spy/CpxP family protein refolding chaperone